MVRFTGGLLLFSALAAAAPAERNFESSTGQQVIQDSLIPAVQAPRKLQGRFLHITDVHPDPYYEPYTSPEGDHPCHTGSGNGTAGFYGAETTDCDTPFSLVNATFKWINDNLKDKVDFVIWTGDSARHDNDEQYPREDAQVVDLNKFVVRKFIEVFGKGDNLDDPDPTNDFVVPIVPTFGNNDILPHNIFEPGPNRWTRKYEDVWKYFIPQEQKHSFARGGWFFSEVIPNKLAVFSLNTLYFFDSNSAVDGCDMKSEPGYEHMEWLRIQLQFLRQRGMKAMLIGHVPPARTDSKQNWDESCYQKFTLWLRQYRDVVVGSIFGHMNIDHFMFQDVKELTYKFKINGVDDEFSRSSSYEPHPNDPEFSIAAKADYLIDLRDGWAKLPVPPHGISYAGIEAESTMEDIDIEKKKKKKKKSKMEKFLEEIGGPWGERFSLSLVSPSVVPNYFPTLRIVEYNISGLENHGLAVRAIGKPASIDEIWEEPLDIEISNTTIIEHEEADDDHTIHDLKKKPKKGKKKNKKKKARKPSFPVPRPPSRTSEPGPAYSPQTLSLLSWTQFYANLTKINDAVESDGGIENVGSDHKHFNYHVEYSTNNDSTYKMKDLTVRMWLDIAEKIGRTRFSAPPGDGDGDSDGNGDLEESKKKKKKKKAKNHLWRTFVKRAFVKTKQDDDLDDQFG